MRGAFDALLGRYLEHGLGGSSHKTPVQVNVTLSADALTGAPGVRPATGDSGAPISRALLRRWWCDSNITAYVLNRGGKALRAVHLGRTLTALERRGAHLEHSNRCAGIGCCRSGLDPTVELRPHHVIGYAESGSMSIDDTILVCDVLHRDIHDGPAGSGSATAATSPNADGRDRRSRATPHLRGRYRAYLRPDKHYPAGSTIEEASAWTFATTSGCYGGAGS